MFPLFRFISTPALNGYCFSVHTAVKSHTRIFLTILCFQSLTQIRRKRQLMILTTASVYAESVAQMDHTHFRAIKAEGAIDKLIISCFYRSRSFPSSHTASRQCMRIPLIANHHHASTRTVCTQIAQQQE
jgi:hypothetical protein